MLPLPPRLANRYRVGAVLGHGAIAEVVRGFDEQTGADVALKVLYPALRESAVVVQRFRQEVALCRRIDDRHVLAIHDVVESDGFLFLVMDYRPGGDLADCIARHGRLDAAAICTLARQLGGALGAAHQVGIVHRDVKPSNVLAGAGIGSADDLAARLDVRLCDFGLARAADGSGLTTSAAVLGTPEYMAPEVIAEGHADPRSDLYSLGIVLFEAATGRVPFLADSPYQLMRLQLQEAPPRARDLVPDLPAHIDAAIGRALEKDPLDRFASAAEMVEAFAAPTEATALSWDRWALSESARRGRPGAGVASSSVGSTVPAGAAGAAGAARAVCAACGGWLLASAALCVDCGQETLHVEHDRKGVSVMVTGPGETGDKLDARKHVDLFRLLDELPQALDADPAARRSAAAPRLPFYVARFITEASAERLLPRLAAIGLQAQMVRGWALRPKAMRKKVNTLSFRIVACTGFAGWGIQLHKFFPDDFLHFPGFPGWTAPMFFMLPLLAIPSAMALFLARRLTHPLLPVAPAARSGKALPAATEIAAIARLTRGLRGLSVRQDRRLLARILERLLQLRDEGESAIAGAAARAADLAGALVALETADQASAQSALALPAAQAEVRRAERGRVLLRTELLRLFSHIEELAAGRLRARLRDAGADVAAVQSATATLALSMAAERELEEFLSSPTRAEPNPT